MVGILENSAVVFCPFKFGMFVDDIVVPCNTSYSEKEKKRKLFLLILEVSGFSCTVVIVLQVIEFLKHSSIC